MLVLLIVAAPVATGDGSALAVEALFNLVLVAGAYSVVWRRGRIHGWGFLILTGVTLCFRWTALFSELGTAETVSAAMTVVWLVFVVAAVVQELFQRKSVTTNTIFAAIVAYLLMGVAFAYAFELLELFQPGSFSGLGDTGDARDLGNSLMYFSFVSLTTMGYGDILAVSGLARPLAVLEGVFGTLFLTITIARLVGQHLSSNPGGQGT